MSSYAGEEELYLNEVKIFTRSNNLSHVVHFFQNDDLTECPFGLKDSIEYAEELSEKGLISDYSTIDPVKSSKTTKKGEKLEQEIEDILEDLEDVEERLDYNSA